VKPSMSGLTRGASRADLHTHTHIYSYIYIIISIYLYDRVKVGWGEAFDEHPDTHASIIYIMLSIDIYLITLK